jgi:hypothetical protein
MVKLPGPQVRLPSTADIEWVPTGSVLVIVPLVPQVGAPVKYVVSPPT